MRNFPETVEEFLDGQILLIDTPLGWTSFDVVKKIKNLIRTKYNLKKIKVGHAGTLDPLATGVLIVCTGKCTKQISTIQSQEKIFLNEFKQSKNIKIETDKIKESTREVLSNFNLSI